eukprot:10906854-Ditylum_brightwellii.AAC.1
MWLNAFPPRGGVSNTFSLRTIITGMVLNTNKHCRIPFGSYAQTHEEDSNDMREWTLGAISLGPVGNVQGSYKFMNLRTGKAITRHDFDEIPATHRVIQRVNKLGELQKQQGDLLFYNCNQVLIADNDDATTTNDTTDGSLTG